jgi:predicted dienelactone hydrolase
VPNERDGVPAHRVLNLLHIREDAMIRLIVVLLFALASVARAAGFQEVMAPDPGHPAIELGIWYPSGAAVSDQPLELFHQAVARDGAIAAGRHPMVLISHGQGGSFGGHYDTALALAAAGYVVVALTHTGDNYRDQSGVLNIMERPRQVSRVIDYMLAAWPGHNSIDAERIGLFGFSAGAFTALVSAGGIADLTKSTPYCAAHPTQYTCKLIEAHGGRVIDPPASHLRDSRIKAVVVAAPAAAFAFMPNGLRGVTMPVQLWRADADQILPAPDYADAVRTALPSPPDFQTVPGAGHFDFLAACSDALARVAPAICQDPPGFDRAAFHQRFNASVVAFFNQTL